MFFQRPVIKWQDPMVIPSVSLLPRRGAVFGASSILRFSSSQGSMIPAGETGRGQRQPCCQQGFTLQHPPDLPDGRVRETSLARAGSGEEVSLLPGAGIVLCIGDSTLERQAMPKPPMAKRTEQGAGHSQPLRGQGSTCSILAPGSTGDALPITTVACGEAKIKSSLGQTCHKHRYVSVRVINFQMKALSFALPLLPSAAAFTPNAVSKP